MNTKIGSDWIVVVKVKQLYRCCLGAFQLLLRVDMFMKSGMNIQETHTMYHHFTDIKQLAITTENYVRKVSVPPTLRIVVSHAHCFAIRMQAFLRQCSAHQPSGTSPTYRLMANAECGGDDKSPRSRDN